MIDVPENTRWNEIIEINIYSPFEREKLIKNAIESYGYPIMTRTSGDKKNNLTYDEYLGDYGRIRIYNEANDTEQGWEVNTWLEVSPGKLYLENVISKRYLKDIQYQNGNWKLSVSDPLRTWYFTFELEDNAITKISDIQL